MQKIAEFIAGWRDGGRSWFAIDSKSFEISIEHVKGNMVGKITEKGWWEFNLWKGAYQNALCQDWGCYERASKHDLERWQDNVIPRKCYKQRQWQSRRADRGLWGGEKESCSQDTKWDSYISKGCINKLATLNRFVGMLVDRFDEEILALMRGMEPKKGELH